MKKVYILVFNALSYGREFVSNKWCRIVGVYCNPDNAQMDMLKDILRKKGEMNLEYRFDGEYGDEHSASLRYLDDYGNCYEYGWVIVPFMVKGEVK